MLPTAAAMTAAVLALGGLAVRTLDGRAAARRPAAHRCPTAPTGRPATATDGPLGLLVPLYGRPTDNAEIRAGWCRIIAGRRHHPGVPVLVVLDFGGRTSGGPGPADAALSGWVGDLTAAGVTVAGYVPTSTRPDGRTPCLGCRPARDVDRDVDTWVARYPTLSAVFLDEAPPGDADTGHYRSLAAHARSHRQVRRVVVNPGTAAVPRDYLDVADLLVLHEAAGYPTDAELTGAGWTPADRDRLAALVYRQAAGPADVAALDRRLGWIYVTDEDVAGPTGVAWDHLSPYFEALLTAADRPPAG